MDREAVHPAAGGAVGVRRVGVGLVRVDVFEGDRWKTGEGRREGESGGQQRQERRSGDR